MSDLLRESLAGQLIRYFTKDKVFKYREEEEGFQCPSSYTCGDAPEMALGLGSILSTAGTLPVGDVNEKSEDEETPDPDMQPGEGANEKSEEEEVPGPEMETTLHPSLRTTDTASDSSSSILGEDAQPISPLSEVLSSITSRVDLEHITTRRDLERAYTEATMRPQVKREPTQPIRPEKTGDGTILVDWYDTDDQENPQNWSFGKKCVVAFVIYLYTLAVYLGSAIYTPAEPYIAEKFGVSPTAASLGLALYVLGYGIGPLLFSPISEIPVVGRNPPYLLSFGIFVILCVPTALVDNFAGLLVLRFLQGFFGSPCLATGGASIGDIFSLLKMPYGLSLWAAFATCGPALGPIISGFSVPAENWRWALWEILWLAGPVFVIMFFFLPETSSSNILLRRAARLQKLTGNPKLKSQAEINQSKLEVSKILYESLVRPLQIMTLDPAVLFTGIYTSLVYGIYYSFFEAFPIVYMGSYGFNLGQMGLTFLSISVSVALAIPSYWAYMYYVVEPEIMTKGLTAPERRLIPALFASFLLPAGLFMFGWTAKASIHWIVSVIGIGIYSYGVFILLQCVFVYIPMSYPQYAASLFAGNDFVRSALASGAILFARPLYLNLGIGHGVSLLAGLTCGCVVGIFALYFFGANLRARSKFAAK